MKVGDFGEFELIERLRGILPPVGDERLVVGIGDDAAVWRTGDSYAVATTDTMVAGVHFLPELARWREVGWKALTANVSDIAAMGGTPSFAMITLCLPPDTLLAAVDEVYAGIAECAREYGVTVAGGDIVRAKELAITIALAGEAAVAPDGTPQLLLRSGARAEDVVAVTGSLGGSAGGLRALREGLPDGDAVRRLVERHLRPRPRVDVGRSAVLAGVRCAIDVSDGLVRDVGHICEQSALGAELWEDRLPIEPALRDVFPADAATLAASGGEDYELVFVGPEATIARLRASIDVPLTDIGRMTASDDHRARMLDATGSEVAFKAVGWDHFGRSG
jgi:thiamine-monophosphate kinase